MCRRDLTTAEAALKRSGKDLLFPRSFTLLWIDAKCCWMCKQEHLRSENNSTTTKENNKPCKKMGIAVPQAHFMASPERFEWQDYLKIPFPELLYSVFQLQVSHLLPSMLCAHPTSLPPCHASHIPQQYSQGTMTPGGNSRRADRKPFRGEDRKPFHAVSFPTLLCPSHFGVTGTDQELSLLSDKSLGGKTWNSNNPSVGKG